MMMATLEVWRENSLPIHIQLLNDLRQKVMTGVLQPHERLPSEWELVATLGISRATVQHAWQAAEQEGLIYRVPGKFVTRAVIPGRIFFYDPEGNLIA